MFKPRFLRLFSFLIAIFFCLGIAYSQDKPKTPSEQFGIGFKYSEGSFGGQAAFAVTPTIHIGAGVGFYYNSGDDFENSETYLSFSPYCKMLLDPIKTFYPMLIGAFDVTSMSVVTKDALNRDVTNTETNTGLSIYAGGEWFPYSSVGVYAGFKFLGYNFDPSELEIGLGRVFIGLEWFVF